MFALGTGGWRTLEFLYETFPRILSFAVLVLMAAIGLGFWYCRRECARANQEVWKRAFESRWQSPAGSHGHNVEQGGDSSDFTSR
jgi:hypothetical protein